MRMREFQKRLDKALANVRADINKLARRGGEGRDGQYARGLANEGFAGGYAEALRDVDAIIRHGHPRDDRRYWRGRE